MTRCGHGLLLYRGKQRQEGQLAGTSQQKATAAGSPHGASVGRFLSERSIPMSANHNPQTAGTAAELLKALNHPVRRSVLRLLLEAGPSRSSQARTVISMYAAPNLINHHLGILERTGAVVREYPAGRGGSLYRCTEAVEAEWVLTALQLTAEED